jgi:hypothetical protein
VASNWMPALRVACLPVRLILRGSHRRLSYARRRKYVRQPEPRQPARRILEGEQHGKACI